MRVSFNVLSAWALLTLLISCSETSPPPVENTSSADPTESFYIFTIYEGHIAFSDTNNPPLYTIDGLGMKATWKQDYGLAWLSTDDTKTSGPYGTFTIKMGFDTFSNKPIVESLIMSATDVLTGTAMELNARNYAMGGGQQNLQIRKNTENLVHASLMLYMVRTSPNQSPEPLNITLVGEFAVVDK